tara:strand:+ start:123 stop:398 length:276 start_codon:yes stop_codon:yes gene_type:complete
MKVFVAGGAGYIGSICVEELLKTGHEVTVLDNLSEGSLFPSLKSPGDPARLIASSQKAIDELHWKPRYATLEQIVDSAWRWHSSHPNGYSG